MNKYINHIELSNQHLKRAEYYDSLNADQSLVAAQVEATLALVEQQRIANLISLSALAADTDEKEELSREATMTLVKYQQLTLGGPVPYIDEVLVVRPEIATALGIEAGDDQ